MHLGTLNARAVAVVETDGSISADGAHVEWRVRPADAWLHGGSDVPVRQSRPYGAPIVETAMWLNSGDARARAYAIDVDGGGIVMEVENDTPAAVAVAFAIDVSDDWVVSHSRPIGATESDGAIVFPVPHRTSVRIVLARSKVDARTIPDAPAVARAWGRVLDQGMRVELPDDLQTEVDARRADLFTAPPSGAVFADLEAWGFDNEAAAL